MALLTRTSSRPWRAAADSLAISSAQVQVAQRESDYQSALAVVAQRDSDLDTAKRRLPRSEQLARDGFFST